MKSLRYAVLALAIVAVGVFAYSLYAQPDLAQDVKAESPAEGEIAFDWVVIGDEFYLEVKNGSRDNFILDSIFAQGYNLHLIGLNADFEQVYITNFFEDIDRGPVEKIDIPPGNFHRVKYNVATHNQILPEDVKYVKFRWMLNIFGTRLPGPVESTIYELRREQPTE